MVDLQAQYDLWRATEHNPTLAELSAWWIEYWRLLAPVIVNINEMIATLEAQPRC